MSRLPTLLHEEAPAPPGQGQREGPRRGPGLRSRQERRLGPLPYRMTSDSISSLASCSRSRQAPYGLDRRCLPAICTTSTATCAAVAVGTTAPCAGATGRPSTPVGRIRAGQGMEGMRHDRSVA